MALNCKIEEQDYQTVEEAFTPVELEKYTKGIDEIIFRGKVTNVEQYLQASDVYIATSKSEGLPNGVLEAMACGLPVLLSDIPQHLEVLDTNRHCGYSYTLGSIDELVKKMDGVFELNLIDMGENSYHTVVNNFTAKGMSNKYQELYIKLCRGVRQYIDNTR